MKIFNCFSLCIFICTLCTIVTARYKVINGDPVSDWASNKYKFIVYLYDTMGCTGSWLGGKHILTAAHCTCKAVHVSWALFERVNAKTSNSEKIAIASQQNHPGYTQCDKEEFSVAEVGSDVSVAILAQAPTTSKHITKIDMNLAERPQPGTIAFVVGYGQVEMGVLKTGTVKIEECAPKYKPSPICAKSDPRLRDQKTAGGDSGSPLLIEVGGKRVCVGTEAGNYEVKGKPETYTMLFTSAKYNAAFIKGFL